MRQILQLSSEEFNEFKLEALELIDGAEKCLLRLDSGADFKKEYDSIFRAFHNLKGSAGMLELTQLQEYTHQIETTLTQQKEKGSIPRELIDYFLESCDQIRKILQGEKLAGAPVASQLTAVSTCQDQGAAEKPLLLESPEVLESALQFVLSHYVTLDSYFQMCGNEEERERVRIHLSSILNLKKAS